MKKPVTKLMGKIQPPVFKIVIQKSGANLSAAGPKPMDPKRAGLVAKPRATREDRGPRPAKITIDSQKLFRLCAHLSP